MGSIQLFPRALPRQLAAHAWRAAPLGQGTIRVREARVDDYAAVRMLHRHASPHLPPLTLRDWERRIHEFGQGQFVATCDAHVVGAACSRILAWDDYGTTPDFEMHAPGGTTLYGVELAVNTALHGFKIGRVLFQARRRLCRRFNLRRIVATARLGGYDASREALSPEQYATRIVWGEIPDGGWRFLMAQGFQYCGILHDHRPQDVESGGHAALLAWLNPLYAPPGPPAFQQSERARKCA